MSLSLAKIFKYLFIHASSPELLAKNHDPHYKSTYSLKQNSGQRVSSQVPFSYRTT